MVYKVMTFRAVTGVKWVSDGVWGWVCGVRWVVGWMGGVGGCVLFVCSFLFVYLFDRFSGSTLKSVM